MPQSKKNNPQFIYRNPAVHGKKLLRDKRRPPRWPLALIALIFVAAIIFAIVLLVRNSGKEGDNAVSSSNSSSMDVTREESGSDPGTSSGLGEDGGSQAENYDSLTPAADKEVDEHELFNTMMIADGAGYRYYSFSEQASIQYIELVSSIRSRLDSDVPMYSLILPNSTDIMLPQSFLADVSQTSDQQKALDYLNASIRAVAPTVHTLDVYDILKANSDKDIFFKTDRNWTALGAYYAYRQFVQANGMEAKPLSYFEQGSVPGFTGSLFEQSNYNELLDYTETITTYLPPDDVTVSYQLNGETVETNLLTDVSQLDAASKSAVFIGGDRAYTTVTNNSLEADNSIFIIKDTMANAMIPFLSCHFKNIYIVDYYFYSGDAIDLLEDTGAQELLLMVRINSTCDSYNINLLDEIV